MKKILYSMTSHSHRRVFESLITRNDVDQIIVGPTPVITNNIVPEDYSDFKIKVVTYNNRNEMKKIINSFKPDFYVQSDLSPAHKNICNHLCKKIIVHHGAVGNHAVGIAYKLGSDVSVWKGFDLYCGANHEFHRWAKSIGKARDDQVVINSVPQFDLLYNSNYYNSYKNKVLNKIGYNGSVVIMFVGFCCKDRIDFNEHNEDYFRTAIKLEAIAKKNNWLVLIKPRHTYSEMMSFLSKCKWGNKYKNEYKNIQHSKNLHFITTTGHIYRYFFSDLVIVNGSSTVELETCMINKPLIVIRNERNKVSKFDPYSTIKSGSGTEISNLDDLDSLILDMLKNKQRYCQHQDGLVKSHGITFDGKMHSRLQNAIMNLG